MNVITKITKFPYLSERLITTNLTFVTSAFTTNITESDNHKHIHSPRLSYGRRLTVEVDQPKAGMRFLTFE